MREAFTVTVTNTSSETKTFLLPGLRVLRLTLHKKWFDKIASGRKTHEFRVVKPYWTSRLVGKEYDLVEFRNGYRPDSPLMKAEMNGVSQHTVKGVKLYAIHIGRIISIQNYAQQ